MEFTPDTVSLTAQFATGDTVCWAVTQDIESPSVTDAMGPVSCDMYDYLAPGEYVRAYSFVMPNNDVTIEIIEAGGDDDDWGDE